jgi:Secretion system C-terminal sorting domain
LTFLFSLLCCQLAFAGGNSRVSPYEQGGLKTANSSTSNYIMGGGGKGIANQAAYFNLKPTVARPNTTLQTRSSAITITEADLLAMLQPNMRQETRRSTLAATSITMNIGTADNVTPQTWTLPVATLSLLTRNSPLDFIAIADVPLAARVTGATHVTKQTFQDPDDGHDLIEYSHYQMVAGDQLNEMGITMIDTDDGDALSDRSDAPEIFSDAPLDVGDVVTTEITDYLDDGDFPKVVSTSTVTVDAFGTINNPFGGSPATFDCLRLSIESTEADYTTNSTTPSSTTTHYFVAWVTKEGFRFYAKKPTQNASGAGVTLTNLEMMRIFPFTALAVELIDFKGETTKNGVDLTWTTASEKNNNYYDVERSVDGKTFEKIGQVKGNGTTTAKQSYTFTDNTPLSILTYYRLRQVDFDGTSTTSNIISIPPKDNAKGIKIYPNPSAASQITLDFAADAEGVSVVNALGQVVFQQKTMGQNRLQLDISTWAKGVYFVKTTENTEGVKFVKQ